MSLEAFELKILTLLIAVVLIGYLFLWIVFLDDVLPGSSMFTLIILCIIGTLFSVSVERTGLPGIFGSLIAGVLVANGFGLQIARTWSSTIRLAALGVILLRSGLGLEWNKLKDTAFATLFLSCLPAFAETVTSAVLIYAFLSLPWLWCFMLGFGLSAISPAVIVPCMLKLQSQGYGEAKGVTTLILAAAGLDDIVGVTGFTVLSGFIGASESIVLSIMKAPIEIFGGIFAGFVVGLACWYLFEYVDVYRYRTVHFIVVTIVACSLVLGFSLLQLKGAGAIAIIVYGLVLASYTSPADKNVALKKDLKLFWKTLMQNLLFSLIGASIIVSDLDGVSVGFGVLIIFLALIPRSMTAYCAVYITNLTHDERLFVAIAWLPKATVQAAVASIPLDIVNSETNPDPADQKRAYQVLTILVLSIFLTAPPGAKLVSHFGPRLLSNDKSAVKNEDEDEDEDEENQDHKQDQVDGIQGNESNENQQSSGGCENLLLVA